MPDGESTSLASGIAYVHGPEDGYALNLEAAYSTGFFSTAINAKFLEEFPANFYGANLEGRIWFLLSFGAGVGYLAGSDHGFVFNTYLGVPGLFQVMDDFFLEPYYRANFFLPNGLEVIHEVGILFRLMS